LLSGSDETTADVKVALLYRLQFRAKFLRIVEVAASRTSPGIKAMWTDLLSYLPQVISSAKLGKSVPESFSVKVQRKLASTVPPRPIVHVSQDRAFEHLGRLCRDAAAAVDVFEYHDSHSLFVCTKYCSATLEC
jgi:N-alpha-acetyltransferase 35, NatC auxiliary subunit